MSLPISETIRYRRSVRAFDGTPLMENDKKALLDYAGSVSNPYGLAIEWHLLDAAARGIGSPVITGEDTYIAGKMKKAPHAEEAFGFAFEKILLHAAAEGIGSTIIAGTMDRKTFERAIDLQADEVMPCVSPLGYPASRMSLRESLMRKGIKAATRLPFEALFYHGDWSTPLNPEGIGALGKVLELVRLAPSAVNKQPWRVLVTEQGAHFYEKPGKGYKSADGWDIQKIDMGIALCHFDLGMEEYGLPCRFSLEDPGLPHPEELSYIASYLLA